MLSFFGPRRIGKTALLYRLSKILSQSSICISLDCSAFPLKTKTSRVFVQAILRELQPKIDSTLDVSATVSWEDLGRTIKHIQPKNLILMLDEFDFLMDNQEILSGLRAILMAGDMSLVTMSAENITASEAIDPRTSSLVALAICIPLQGLPPNAARTLLLDPVGNLVSYSPAALDRVIKVTGGHPFLLKLMGQTILEQCVAQNTLHVGEKEVEEVISLLCSGERSGYLNSFLAASPDLQKAILQCAPTPEAVFTEQQIANTLEAEGTPYTPSNLQIALRRLLKFGALCRKGWSEFTFPNEFFWLLLNRTAKQ
jgi:hypothetical protein